MDMIVAEVLSKWYIYFYDQVGAQVHAPPPTQLFEIVSHLLSVIYNHSPAIVRTYLTVLNTIMPVHPQENEIVPVVLATLVLYALFSIIVFTVRGLYRCFMGFLRFSIILSLVTVSFAILLQSLHITVQPQNGI
ncbi:uncharacterized protein EV154DRAFT_493823, partial [Mucor mucedo]|uniref:uncharacterized protein n=1 Tax=Mucor mucedo TaxID=29922 RepID=UPI0022201D7C